MLPEDALSHHTFVIENVRIIPMDRERVIEGQAVLIQKGRITGIGDIATLQIPADAVHIDGHGDYLLPGLADMHVHLFSPNDLISYLAYGVTTVTNMDGASMHLDWRRKAQQKLLLSPTIYTAGATLDGYPPLNGMFHVLETPEQARRTVRAQKRAGYDFIKVYGTLNPDVYAAILVEAKAQRIAVIGHIVRQVGAAQVIAGSQVMIAHGEEYLDTWFKDGLDENQIGSATQATAKAGMTVTANLTTLQRVMREVQDLRGALAEPEMRYLSPSVYSQWMPSNNRNTGQSNSKEYLDYLQSRQVFLSKFVVALHTAGVPLLLGTDSAVNGFPGLSAHEELRLLVKAGLTPYQALSIATRNAGVFIKQTLPQSDSFGVIAVGQRADLLLLGGNPLANIENVGRIRGVMVRGRWFTQETLQREREAATSHYVQTKAKIDDLDRLVEMSDEAGAKKAFQDLMSEAQMSPPIAQWVLMIKGQRWRESKPHFARSLAEMNRELYPNAFSVYFDLGMAFWQEGSTEMARKNFRKSLALNPFNAQAHNQLEKLEALQRPLTFNPIGTYQMVADLSYQGTRREVKLTLLVSGSKGKWEGKFEMNPPLMKGLVVKEIAVGDKSIWVTVDVENGFPLELRMHLKEGQIAGKWSAGYENNGALQGKKVP
jgi:imidazolonepropionase-like amidohydrolase